MGRTPKGWAAGAAAAAAKSGQSKNKKKKSSSKLQVGRVSSNVIASVYAPLLTDMAIESSEKYAKELVDYEDELKSWSKDGCSLNEKEESCRNKPKAPSRPLFGKQSTIEVFKDMLRDTSRAVSNKEWRARVNAAKFERNLDEKYGYFRPFATHPTVDKYLKILQRKHALGAFSVIRPSSEEAPLGLHASIVVLFMMYRNKVRMDGVILAFLFLVVGLQPWALVCGVSLVTMRMNKRRMERPKGMKVNPEDLEVEPYYEIEDGDDDDEETARRKKLEVLKSPVGTPYEELKKDAKEEGYNVIIMGSGPDALFTGALLSRMGRKVLVLSQLDDASGCLTNRSAKGEWATVPFDVQDGKIGRIEFQQKLMAPALCTTMDCQGGIRFAPIGTEADGYAYDVITVPKMGRSTNNNPEYDEDGTVVAAANNGDVPFVLRAGGVSALAQDAHLFLGDGWYDTNPPTLDINTNNPNSNSSTATYLNVCNQLNMDGGSYYTQKLFTDRSKALFGPLGSTAGLGASVYGDASIRYASDFLNRIVPLNPHVRSLMAALGLRNENLSPRKCSMGVHVSNVNACTDNTGFCYPVGGPRALCHAFRNTIEKLGGKVVTGVQYNHFLFEQVDATTIRQPNNPNMDKVGPRCIGIQLDHPSNTSFNLTPLDSTIPGSIISHEGFIPTMKLIPHPIREVGGVPKGLSMLTERRPLLYITCALNGSASDFNLPAADWWRLPNCSLPKDSVDANGMVIQGDMGDDYFSDATIDQHEDATTITATPTTDSNDKHKENTPTTAEFNVDPNPQKPGHPSTRKQTYKKTKFHTGSSWIRISFPSAKDPNFHQRYPNKSTCVITIEADDDFVKCLDTTPKHYAIMPKVSKDIVLRLLDRVNKDLFNTFPQLTPKSIVNQELHGPFNVGLSHTPERYAAKGIKPTTTYPGLYMGGKELTLDSFSGGMVGGWMAANAVMGYDLVDYVWLDKNVSKDLERYLPCPDLSEDGFENGDVAVPLLDLKKQEEDVKVDEEEQLAEGDTSKEK